MDYDKNSFLAGISVGMTMKGWAGGNSGVANSSGKISGYLSQNGAIKAASIKYGGYNVFGGGILEG